LFFWETDGGLIAHTRSWPTLQELGGFSSLPNRTVMRLDDEHGIERLRAVVLRDVATAISPDIVSEVEGKREAIASDVDARRFVERSVVERKCQPQFRRELLKACSGRCCIRRFDAEPALEAAYIVLTRVTTPTPRPTAFPRADLHTHLVRSRRADHRCFNLPHPSICHSEAIPILKLRWRPAALSQATEVRSATDLLEIRNHRFEKRQRQD
jgi:hypothetical protein